MNTNRTLALVALAGLAAHARAQDAKENTWVNDGQHRTIKVWAAKGLMQSPVAVGLDWKGNLYVAESERAGEAVADTRGLGHLHAVEEDLRFKRVEDRLDEINRWIAQGAFPKDHFTKTEDRIRIVRDTDGDGAADWSGVYAGGFNQPLDGIGAGVLWTPWGGPAGSVYYTCIPNLWKLTSSADGLTAASRESLSYGYGVRWCFYGHDLHGLVQGPDGRLYFSMGDRGFNVTTKEGVQLEGPDRGGVFRCWPDGTGLELYHQGLRNPQCLAFSERGDLFTGDNNCDAGDRARVVYVAEQGDSGWRQDVQSLEDRGPWLRERIWQPLSQTPGLLPDGGVGGVTRPACFLPPIENVGDGPSGFRFYPGTGEAPEYDNHFFMVDFVGTGARIHAMRPDPEGAGFKLGHNVKYFDGVTVTDIAWGYDGRLYMADWGGGWSPNLNGVVLVASNDGVHAAQAAAIAEVKALFAAGFAQRPDAELVRLLSHHDSRVRLEAQHELARRPGSAAALTALAADAKATPLARLHAVWGVGELARKDLAVAQGLAPLLSDPDAEVRTQAVKTLGDLPWESGAPIARYVELLSDASARVQREAAIAVGKHPTPGAAGPLCDMLAKAKDQDPVLRSAGAYALSRCVPGSVLAGLAEGKPPAVRLAVVLALRRLWSEEVAAFLDDADAGVAIEAARAVYDLRLDEGMTRLAAKLTGDLPEGLRLEPFLRRALEANVLLGTEEAAARLVSFAGSRDIPGMWRELALRRVAGWDQPLTREGVWGNWVDLPGRPAAEAGSAVRQALPGAMAALANDAKALTLAKSLEARYLLPPEELSRRVLEGARPAAERLAILEELARTDPIRAAVDCRAVLEGKDGLDPATGLLRARAEQVFAKADPGAAAEYLAQAVGRGEIAERQRSAKLIGTLAAQNEAGAVRALTTLAEDLRAGNLDSGLALEVYEGAAALGAKDAASAAWKLLQPMGTVGNRPAGFATALLREGGDAAKGREVFLRHPSAECLRCHTADGLGVVGGNAGPNLSTVGRRQPLSKLVESVVDPGAEVAPGFGAVSAMPNMTTILKPSEVRDVVAFLSTLRGPDARQPSAPSAGSHAPEAPGRSAEQWMLLPGLALLAWSVWPAVRGRRGTAV